MESETHKDNEQYRKITEGTVLLTKEEYENLKFAADKYDPFWFCVFGGCDGACEECKDECANSIYVQERNKTAKEILQEFKNIFIAFNKKDAISIDLFTTRLENICKKYGVDVEE